MPIDPGTATLITTGVAAATSGANMGFQGNMNRKNRRFAEKMYRQQYQDELEFWRMNNQYNHPTAQMERLRNAGLNPHLVYGNGAVANSSSAPSAPNQPKWEGKAPQMETGIGMAGLDQYFNLEAKQAQTDNLRAQNTLLEKEVTLKNLGILQNAFNLDVDYQTKDSIINKVMGEGFRAINENQGILNKNAFDLDRYPLEIELLKAGINVRTAQGENIKVDTGNKAIDTQLKQLDLMLWDKGISRSDPMWMRVIYQFAEKNNLLDANIDVTAPGRKVADYWKKNVGSKYKGAYDYIREGLNKYY